MCLRMQRYGITLVFGLTLLSSSCSKNKSENSPASGRDASALFGQEVGNGGDAVVCARAYPELGGERAGLLDYYEGRAVHGLTPDFSGADGVDGRVALAISRLEALDPDRAGLYRHYAETFWSEAIILQNAHLPDLPDDGPVSLPGEDCRLQQLAIQSEPLQPGHKRYSINGKIWNLLNDDAKAGLILHEIAYREAKSLGHETSARIRHLNGMMAANALKSLSHDAYTDLLEQTLSLPAVRTVSGIKLKMRGMTFADNGQVLSGDSTAEPFTPSGCYGASCPRIHMLWRGISYSLSNPRITFDSSGNLTMNLNSGAFSILADYTEIPSSHGSATCGGISYSGSATFAGDGRLLSIDVKKDSRFRIYPCIPGQPELLGDSLGILLGALEDGKVHFRHGSIPIEPAKALMTDPTAGIVGKALDRLDLWRELYAGDIVTFDENGRLSYDSSPFQPEVARPKGTNYLSSGNGSSATSRIEKQDDALKLFAALERFEVRSDDDGETRYFASNRKSVTIACKRWEDGVAACDVALSADSEGSFTEGEGGWEMKIMAERYEAGSARQLMIKKFLDLLALAPGGDPNADPIADPEARYCGGIQLGKVLKLEGLRICAATYPPEFAVLVVEISRNP